jgi:methylmalonyl-CoA/ethylmalonyl-CoA epimerase
LKKIEHIGIAVKDIEASNTLFAKLLGTSHYKMETVESEGVITSFFQVGDLKIELLQALNEESAISKHIEKRGEGVHHLAFAVDDVNTELQRLKAEGFETIHEKGKKGADGKLIAFLHPKSTNKVLTEICSDYELE